MASSKDMKKNWSDPAYRERMIAGMKSPEAKAKRAAKAEAKKAEAETLAPVETPSAPVETPAEKARLAKNAKAREKRAAKKAAAKV